jgi:hypothetical protein
MDPRVYEVWQLKKEKAQEALKEKPDISFPFDYEFVAKVVAASLDEVMKLTSSLSLVGSKESHEESVQWLRRGRATKAYDIVTDPAGDIYLRNSKSWTLVASAPRHEPKSDQSQQQTQQPSISHSY